MRTKLIGWMAFWMGVVHTVSATPPVPKVTITAPSQVLIGDKFEFTLTFESDPSTTNPPTIGFAPFIDLVWDFGGADHNNPPPVGGGPCDGIKILSADMMGVNGGPISLPLQNVIAPCGSNAPLPHPFGGSPFGPVIVATSGQMSTLVLPFGSFVSTQPTVTIKIVAQVHNFADAGHPLFIYARAGFRYGNDPLNVPTSDPPILSDNSLTASAWGAQATVTPAAFVVSKTCGAPEQETASGPNYPRQCEISVDVAPGQTITDLIVTDCLSSNMQYLALAPTTTPGYTVLATPPACLKLKYPSVTGGAGPEIKIVFKFFVPLNDTNGPVLDPNSCTNASLVDSVTGEGDWVPLDPRDVPSQHLTSNPSQASLTAKRITIQKSVKVMPVPGGPIRPGKLLQWTIDVNISDYFTVGELSITDLVADGQDLLLTTAFFPTLDVSDRRKPPPTHVPLAVNQTITHVPNPGPPNCGGVKGGTTVTFHISQAMQSNPGAFFGMPVLQAGILTGGHAFPPYLNTPATARIVFFTMVRDKFMNPQTPGDQYVDKDDPINNCVEGTGTIYTNDPNTPQPVTPPPLGAPLKCSDDSSASVVLPGDVLQKTVYEVKRGTAIICGPGGPTCSNAPNPPQQARPGDVVSFRLRKPAIPSSDAENLTVEDWLPLPPFDVSDPNGDLVLGPPWVFTNTTSLTQNPGKSHILSTDTLHSLVVASRPIFTTDPLSNSIKFDYGTFFDTNNTPRAMDLVFTATVTPQPYADGLFLSNVARECEDNTFGNAFCQVAIAQVNVRQPVLRIQKGVVGTNNPKGLFTPALTPAGQWLSFGTSCPRFNPSITSANLPGLIGSNLSNVDANDWATFAIAVENIGGAPAYDIELVDIIPTNTTGSAACLPSCFLPDYSGLCVRRGDGVVIPFTTAPGVGGTTIIKLASPLQPGPPFSPPGGNIVIITFNAQLLPDILPGCCDNIAALTHYASQPGGPNFVSAGFTPPFADSATLCVNPIPVKSVVDTSEKHTKPQVSTVPQTAANTPGVTLGEIVRYRMATAIPEGGMLNNFQLTDTLPPGLQFMNDGTARIVFISTNGTGITHSLGAGLNVSGNQPVTPTQPLPAGVIPNNAGASCGAPVTFSLGNIQNTENDLDSEYVVIEFNALVCNVSTNQGSPLTTLPNSFSVSINGTQVAASDPINVVVVEPHLDVKKIYTPFNPAMPASFTVTLTNTGSSDAFDVHLMDTLPAGLTLAPLPAPSVTVSPSGCAVPTWSVSTTSGVSTFTVDVPRLQVAPGCTVTLKFWVQGWFCGTNTAQVSYSSLPGGMNSHPTAPVGTQSNSTGSITPCLPANNQQDCERAYADVAQITDTSHCPPCAAPPPDMVAWWSLNEANGATVVNDIAGYNNQGVPKPGTPLGAANAPGAVPGRVSGAVNFNSTYQQSGPYIEVPDHPELNFGPGPFSIDTWVFVPKPPSIYIHPVVDKIALNSAGTQGTGYELHLLSSTAGCRMQLAIGDGGTVATYLSPTTSLVPYGIWAHIAVTVSRNPGAVTFYVNGAALPAVTTPPVPVATTNNTLPLWIGELRQAGPHQAPIALDELEMFNRALQPNEVNSIYVAGPTGKCKCAWATNEVITCNGNGTFNYALTITNISSFSASGAIFSGVTNNVTITPSSPAIPLLAPGASTTVSVTIGGAGAISGNSVCFLLGLTESAGVPPNACRVRHCVTLPPCAPPACAPQPPNMVSWWPLNEPNGATLVADTKGGYNGTPTVNGVSGTVVNAQPGKVNGSVNFYSNHGIVVASTPSLALGTSNLSIDAWVFRSQSQFVAAIADTLDLGAKKGYALYVENQILKCVIGDGSTFTTYSSSSQVGVSNTAWHHVAVTINRSTKAGIFYIDGNQAGNFTLGVNGTVNIGSSSPLIIGDSRLSFSGTPQPCVCEFSLDEVEIFNGVVSSGDINAIVSAGSTGKCP